MTAPDLGTGPLGGWLVLAGGGEFSFGETRELDEFTLAKLPPEGRRIAFLPTASGSAEYARHLSVYLATIDPTVEVVNVPIYRGRDPRRARSLQTLRDAAMIYIGGGVTNQIADTLRGTDVPVIIREVLSAGKVVFGIGAGAAALGSHVTDMRSPGHAIEGLGVLPGVAIESGFDPSNDTPLRRLASVPEVRLIVGIPRATALAIAPDGTSEIVGTGQLAVARKPPR